MIRVRRVYDKPRPDEGKCFLVDRLWPRGISKESLKIDAWLKDIAPSDSLRRWFGHDPERWEEFRQRYNKELDENRDALKPFIDALKKGNVILIFSAKDLEHNNAVVLKEYLERKIKK